MNVDQFINEIIPIQDPTLRTIIEKTAKIETVPPHYIISNMGEGEKTISFLISGAIWGYMYNSAGQDITICFVTKTGEVICGSEFLGGDASEITLETITDSEVFVMPLDIILGLRNTYTEIENLYLQIMVMCLRYHWETKKMLYLRTAKERYEWFMKEYPGLIDKVNHAKIASFLNITPVTLSRIRNQVNSSKIGED